MGKKFWKKIRVMFVKVQKQDGDESTIGYPATEHGEKERQGTLHYIRCTTYFCDGCSIVFLVFHFAMFSIYTVGAKSFGM